MCGAFWSAAEAALERWLVRFALYFASVKAAAMGACWRRRSRTSAKEKTPQEFHQVTATADAEKVA